MQLDEFTKKRLYLEMKGFNDKPGEQLFLKVFNRFPDVTLRVTYGDCIYQDMEDLKEYISEGEEKIGSVIVSRIGDYFDGILNLFGYRINAEGSYSVNYNVVYRDINYFYAYELSIEEVSMCRDAGILLYMLRQTEERAFESLISKIGEDLQ
jgi:hypothetical protein